jgi:hypothetical protein
MGVAPKAMVELYFFEYRLKVSLNVSIIIRPAYDIFHLLIFLSGARPALPMGVALEAMMGVLAADYRLKNCTSSTCSALSPFCFRRYYFISAIFFACQNREITAMT